MKSIVRSFIKNINYKHIKKYIGRNYMPVSYTHLKLPTKA